MLERVAPRRLIVPIVLAAIVLVAFGASALTFVSGFGLGTLLLPVFALFYPLEQAVAWTGVVHLLNGVFKLTLVGRRADRRVVLLFGVPAIAASLVGAWLLVRVAAVPALATYTVLGVRAEVTPAKLVVGAMLFGITLLEVTPRFRAVAFPPRYIPLGGAVSGFFGGLSGMQGALRSAFLIRAGLSKEAFIGTGVAVACLIDVSRLSVYARAVYASRDRLDLPLLGAAVAAAFAGAIVGNRLLAKLTLVGVQRIVASLLGLFALGLIAGIL